MGYCGVLTNLIPRIVEKQRVHYFMRTSETHPLYVDFVQIESDQIRGKLGLTFAPGKCHPSPTGDWARDLDKDLARLREHWKTDLLVSLIEEHEFERLHIPKLLDRVNEHAMNVIWFPIRDQSVPTSVTEFHKVVTKINDALRSGQTVIVHCMGGLGRSGLVVAACLVALLKITPEEAITKTRKARAAAIQTPEQEEYIFTYYDFILRQNSG